MRALLLFALLLPLTAEAQFLPRSARAIPLADSASRDAPVFEMAYGPKPQASLGGELGIFRHQGRFDFRLSAYTLAAFENGQSQLPPPLEFGRILFGVTTSFAMTPPAGLFEFSIGAGRQQSFQTTSVVADATRAGDIPFGGGGTFLTLDAAWSHVNGPFEFTVRLDERLHIPELVRLVGQHVLADVLIDLTGDGLSHEPSLDAVIRWKVSTRWQPLLSLHGGMLIPNDSFTRLGFFGRAMIGVAFPGVVGELWPFFSVDVGNGQGLLINRHELRFSGGVRYAFF